MKKQIWRSLAVGTALASAMMAQNGRQASMMGGGGPDYGKCTIEVVVDDVAQVEIRGTSAVLRTMVGAPAQWRRFECTGSLPPNPVEFRFAGVDGRGRQSLIRDPRNGGVAVIQIEDKDNGAEGYTFDITWGGGRGGGGFGNNGGQPPPMDRDRNREYDTGQYRPDHRDSDYYRRYQHGFGMNEAIRVCQQAVMAQVSRRFRSAEIHFDETRTDDGPGRQDWVVGMIDVHRRDRREERFRFSCSVDFDSGRVRSADVDQRPLDEDPRWRR